MLNKNLIQSTSSWPFVEIRKLLKERKDIIKKKSKITFQTGYGPSGLPHIGTFGEVARTTMMINALNHIENICLLYTSPSPRDLSTSRMPSSA